jgi:hypothetical protein
MPDGDSIEAIRHDFDELTARVRRLETHVSERQGAFEREMRAGFQSINAKVDGGFESVKASFGGVNARFDGLEAEVRFGFEKIDRLEVRADSIDARLDRIERMLAKALNGGERR